MQPDRRSSSTTTKAPARDLGDRAGSVFVAPQPGNGWPSGETGWSGCNWVTRRLCLPAHRSACSGRSSVPTGPRRPSRWYIGGPPPSTGRAPLPSSLANTVRLGRFGGHWGKSSRTEAHTRDLRAWVGWQWPRTATSHVCGRMPQRSGIGLSSLSPASSDSNGGRAGRAATRPARLVLSHVTACLAGGSWRADHSQFYCARNRSNLSANRSRSG